MMHHSRKIFNIISRGKKTLSLPGNGKLKTASIPAEEDIKTPFNVPMNGPSDLTGRDLISFENYRTQDIYSLLWIALDLKQRAV